MPASSPASSLRPHRRGAWLLAGAVALAASALYVHARVRRVEEEHPPFGRLIEVDGVALHVFDAGESPDDRQAVVLLHGNGAMALDFVLAGTVDAIAPVRRVLAFDRPGFGYSERPRGLGGWGRRWTPEAQADLIARALDQLGVRRAVVFGHSWGTLVAVCLGLRHPDTVAHLVLASGYYYPTPRLDVPLLSLPALPLVGTLMRHTISPLLGRLLWRPLLRRMFGPAPVPASFTAFPKWLALRPEQLRAAAAETAGMIPAAFRLREQYAGLSMPVTIIAGDADRPSHAQMQSERLHRDIGGSALILVPGQGHMLHHLVPQVIEQALREAAGAMPHPVAPGAQRRFTAGRQSEEVMTP